MKIPLHLSPFDHSKEACVARVELHTAMSIMNPKGFREPSRRSTYPTRIERIAAEAFA